MSKVLFLKGLPASGKSTYAKKLVSDFPNKYKRINKDDLRSMLDCSHWSKGNEEFVIFTRNSMARMALELGYDVIIDDTNLHPTHKETMMLIASDCGAEFEEVVFDTPVTECVERDSKRENPVGAKVIFNMYNQYLKKTVPFVDTIPNAILCDIDGTVARMNGRSPYAWSKVDTDLPNKEVIDIVEAMEKQGYEIIFMSGRDGSCFDATRDWLLKHTNLQDFRLFMRTAGDSRKDNIIKEELYRSQIEGKYNVSFVLDDRNQVVDMWRGLGLRCLQVDYGSF